MRNWSTDLTALKKDKKKYAVWRLEQMVNFGLEGKKISRKLLKKNWPLLHIDPKKKTFLKFLLWGKKAS